MKAAALAWQAPIILTYSSGPNAAILTLPDVALCVVDADCEIVYAAEVHEVLGTDGSAVTADIVRASDGTALVSGTSLLAASQTFNLKGTINTVQHRRYAEGKLATDRFIRAGQRVGINFSGTMTACAGVNITVVLRRLNCPYW